MSQGTDTTLDGGSERDDALGAAVGEQDGQAGQAEQVDESEVTAPRSYPLPAPPPRTPTGGFPAPRGPVPHRGPGSGAFPAPRSGQAPWGPGPQHPSGYFPRPDAAPYGAPTPYGTPYGTSHPTSYGQAADYDTDEPVHEGNGAGVTSCVLAILGLLLALRPLVFGSNAMAADTYVALGISVLALVLGVAGARIPRRRPAVVVGIGLSVVALLLIAVIPTL